MSVVAATDILGYEVPESVIVHRMVQNIHPNVRSQLVFASKPKSIKDLYSLASQVAESRAIDDRRKFFEHQAPTVNPQQGKRDFRPVSMAVGKTRRSLSRAVRRWKCSGKGHVRKDCLSSVTSLTRNQGNERGARQ
jgi:methyl coenzyme M reductase alpha subunit